MTLDATGPSYTDSFDFLQRRLEEASSLEAKAMRVGQVARLVGTSLLGMRK